jgi:hypothetical protein
MALKDKNLGPEETADAAIAAAIRQRLEDGRLPCATACSLAADLGCPPALVGATADLLRIPLTACQLGLFGFPGHAKGWEAAGVAELPVPAGLEAALLAARGSTGELTCLALWRVADAAGCSRTLAGFVADRLGVKVRGCQLGAF